MKKEIFIRWILYGLAGAAALILLLFLALFGISNYYCGSSGCGG
jgi:hypothetical protein